MAERKRPGDAGDPADDEVFDDVVADDEASGDDVEDELVSRGGGTAVRERTKGADQPKAKKARRGIFGRIGGYFLDRDRLRPGRVGQRGGLGLRLWQGHPLGVQRLSRARPGRAVLR